MSRSDAERRRDLLESIDAIKRAESTARRYPADDDVAPVALDDVQRRVSTIGEAVKAHCTHIWTCRGPRSYACAT